MQISHESIYTYLFCLPKGELRKELLSYLRTDRRKRQKRGNTHSKRGQIPNMISMLIQIELQEEECLVEEHLLVYLENLNHYSIEGVINQKS